LVEAHIAVEAQPENHNITKRYAMAVHPAPPTAAQVGLARGGKLGACQAKIHA